MRILNIVRRSGLALLVLAVPAVPALAEGDQTVAGAPVSAPEAAGKTAWDPVAEKTASPYYEMAAYLALKPRREIGNHWEMPGLLADGRCSDPAGEGH